MPGWLIWVIVLGGPVLGAAAGGVTVHMAERIHWHRLAQTWFDDGYSAGWGRYKAQLGLDGPEMVFTPQGTLEPDLGEFEPWPAVDAAFGAAMAGVRQSFDLARLWVGLQ